MEQNIKSFYLVKILRELQRAFLKTLETHQLACRIFIKKNETAIHIERTKYSARIFILQIRLMLMTPPDALKKILKKEAMEKDIKMKTFHTEHTTETEASMVNLRTKDLRIKAFTNSKKLSMSKNQENSSSPKNTNKRVRDLWKVDGYDHLPFPTLVSRIAQQIPGYPEQPKISIMFSNKDFKEMFSLYSSDTKKWIDMNLKQMPEGEILTRFSKNSQHRFSLIFN